MVRYFHHPETNEAFTDDGHPGDGHVEELTRTEYLVLRLVYAAKAHAFKGAGYPEDKPAIEQELKDASAAVAAAIDKRRVKYERR